jgi:hypothetical protein
MSGSKKISELATATALMGGELFPLVQEGETRQAEVSVLRLLSPVQSVNNLTGNVLLALGDLTGVEPIVSAQGVSAAIGAVSLRVDDVETSLSEVSLAIISVQAFLLSEIQVATSGIFTEAPNDGQVYGRQSLTWVPISLLPSIVSISASTYETSAGEANAWFRVVGGVGCSIRIPTCASVAYPFGTMLTFEQAVSGAMTFGGPTINVAPTHVTATDTQFAVVQLFKVGSDSWTIYGNLDTV